MDIVYLRHLAYVLMPAVTVFWGESLRARFLQRGARRAIRLLLAALLAWQFLRLLKCMAGSAVPDTDEALLRLLWYLYYIFRAALPVALLWIAHVADRCLLYTSWQQIVQARDEGDAPRPGVLSLPQAA